MLFALTVGSLPQNSVALLNRRLYRIFRTAMSRIGGKVVDEGRAFLSPPPRVCLQK
jgi:hypothetical protein